jgi:hypothetical protein
VRNLDLIEVIMSLADAARSSAGNRHDRHADMLFVPGGGIPRKVVKGGSHLCAANYCRRYDPMSGKTGG